MNKAAILYSEYVPLIDAIISENNDTEFRLLTEFPENYEDFDLIIDVNFKGEIKSNVLKSHHSLLPAFPGEEPVKEAFLAGVKVTGITVYDSNRIVAQYPIFISNDAHFDDVERELVYLEQVVFPIVIKKILANEPIDLQKALKGGKCEGKCGGKCGGCSECCH